MISRYPLLVFDWDGTLVDSIERIVTSLQHASKITVGVDISEAQARNVIGLGLMEAVEQLHPEYHVSSHAEELNNIADAYRLHYTHENEIPAPLFNGVEELLIKLGNEGYTMAISTGKSRSGLDHAILEHHVDHYFSTTRCAPESKSKPDPEMLHQILNELQFTSDQALMIGDSEHDLKMARNADIKSIGVLHGVHNKTTLNKHAPIAILDRVTDLYDLLQSDTL